MADDYLSARIAHSRRDYVCSEDYDYNFVIPKNLVIKLNAVVEAEKKKRQKPRYFEVDVEQDHPEGTSEEIIVYFPGGTPQLTSGAVFRMIEFYNIVGKLNAWKADVQWLTSTNWRDISAYPELFDVETDSDDLSFWYFGVEAPNIGK
ncbi:hypothetical protein PF008_g10934 [Phytophthora fragariae]|uniref:Uncharacterized protein n=1 Tax=Phytophthora fragariae TaxID=53985 RepID=A0A6G0RTV7_9STRA|nr:hypothetical protein PF008_g10934 [Phytophthora fragariae]